MKHIFYVLITFASCSSITHAAGEKTEDVLLKQWFEAVYVEPDIETVQKLINKVDVNAQGENGRTALILAASNLFRANTLSKYQAIIELLLQAPDINVNIRDMWGNTAFMIAAKCGSEHVVKLLLQMPNIDINAQASSGQNALHQAVSYKKIDVIKILLEVPGINLYAQHDNGLYGKTAVEMAKAEQREDIAQLIQNKISALAYEAFEAIACKDLKKLKVIIAQIGVDKFVHRDQFMPSKSRPCLFIDKDGNNFIHAAFKSGHLDTVLFLLANTQDPHQILDTRNSSRLRPLDLANPTSELFKYFVALAYGEAFESAVLDQASKSDTPQITVAKSKSCEFCKEPASKHCSKCKKVYYCDAYCQKAHWPTHKPDCN